MLPVPETPDFLNLTYMAGRRGMELVTLCRRTWLKWLSWSQSGEDNNSWSPVGNAHFLSLWDILHSMLYSLNAFQHYYQEFNREV